MPAVTNPYLTTSVAEAYIEKREWLSEPPWFSTSQQVDGEFYEAPVWTEVTSSERLTWFSELTGPKVGAYLTEIHAASGTVLDVGSGTGYMSIMRSEGLDYIGIEPSATLHAKAEDLWNNPDAEHENPSCSSCFLNESLETTTVEDGSINCLVAYNSLQYTPNLEVSATLMYALMAPGGDAYIMIPNPDKLFYLPGFPGQSWSERFWTSFDYDEVTQFITGPGDDVYVDTTLTLKAYTKDNYASAFQSAGFTTVSGFAWTAPHDDWPDLRYCYKLSKPNS